jgi:hypothetical protein
MAMNPHPLQPSPSLLCKLGSIVVHSQEKDSITGHAFDAEALRGLYDDSQVVEWLEAMQKLGMVPVKRTMEDVRLAVKAKARKRKKRH